MKKRWKLILGILLLLGLCAGAGVWMIYNGIILLNNPSEKTYPVRGVDVSSYQGEIDWDVLSEQNIQFAFIKATEGSGFEDPYFQDNFRNAAKTELRIGAYHFFSFESAGRTQAENFINAVPQMENMLPPVVDIEMYAANDYTMPDRATVAPELADLLGALEAQYGMKPILYATEHSYERYLADDYEDYDIWIRNVRSGPTLSDGRTWTFWQYTSRERLPGYVGKEKFIDMNVFCGTAEEFAAYP